MSMSLAGGGDVTTEQLEEQFGSVEEAKSWVAAVYDATENGMAAVQWNQSAEGSTQLHDAACSVPGCTGCTAHNPHSMLYLNRLYHSKTECLRPCRLIETLTDGTIRFETHSRNLPTEFFSLHISPHGVCLERCGLLYRVRTC